MSQTFSPEGEAVPVTLIEAIDNVVTARRHEEHDGHDAIQLALPRRKTKKHGPKAKREYLTRREFAVEVAEDTETVSVEQFEVGDVVEVAGISKGKGYQGVVKRHHFKGGPASHGHRHALRQAGSIGAGFPQHVLKGMRMAGRMGGDRVTVKNLTVVSVDAEKKLLAIKGAVPGKKGTVLEITSMTPPEKKS